MSQIYYLVIIILFSIGSTHAYASELPFEKHYRNIVNIDFLNKEIRQLQDQKSTNTQLLDDKENFAPNNYDQEILKLQSKVNRLKQENSELRLEAPNNILQNTDHNFSNYYLRPKAMAGKQKDTQSFIISNLNNYSPKNKNGFYYKSNFTNRIKINFRLKAFPGVKSKYKINIKCSGPFKQKVVFGSKIAKKTNHSYGLKSTLFPDKDLYKLKLELNQNTGNCSVHLKGHTKAVSFFLKPEVHYLTQLELPHPQSVGFCNSPKSLHNPTSTQNYFHRLSGNYTSCTDRVSHIKSLPEGLAGLQERIKILIDKELSYNQLRDIDQDFSKLNQIDFSHAPRLDAIFISSLVFIDDLSGKILLKLLDHHAKNGTQIRIIVSNKTAKKKDTLAIQNFQDKYHNVQFKLLSVKGGSPLLTLKKVIDTKHRVNHVKMFMTYSKNNPENNHAILGGRNLRDVYYFKDLPSGNEDIHYTDFEYSFNSQKMVRSLSHQFLKFWSYFEPSFYVPPTHLHYFPERGPFSYDLDQIYIKNQISYPAISQFELEDDFAKLFDSATETISIITPYLHLTPKLSSSIFDAIERGVEIKIATNLDLNGDSFGGFLTTINGKSVNKLFKNVTMYKYDKAQRILHSKIILIDDDLTVLGSVNLNQRSFYHDTELISYILSRDYNNEINQIAQEYYFDENSIIENKVSSNIFYRLLVRLMPDVF